MNSFEKKILKESEKYAKSSSLKLNPDKKILEAVIKSLAKNFEKHEKNSAPAGQLLEMQKKMKKLSAPAFFIWKK